MLQTFIAPALSSSTPTASKFNLLELGALPAEKMTIKQLQEYLNFQYLNFHKLSNSKNI